MPFAQLKLIRTLMAKVYWPRERAIRPNCVYILRALGSLGVPSIWCYSIFRVVVVRAALAVLIWNHWFLLPCAFANKLLRTERWSCLLGVNCRTIDRWAWGGLPSKCLFEEVSFLSMKVLELLCNGKRLVCCGGFDGRICFGRRALFVLHRWKRQQ